jgi:hypothetical protein
MSVFYFDSGQDARGPQCGPEARAHRFHVSRFIFFLFLGSVLVGSKSGS